MRSNYFVNIFFVLAGLYRAIFALPSKRQDVNDFDILNYALTLELLEHAFYEQGLQDYSQEDFRAAGYDDWVRNRFEQIRMHEKTHVDFLSTALKNSGADSYAQACEYHFDHHDPESFIALSSALEAVGTSAYTGAAKLVSSEVYLTVAASILATEARHSSWIDSAVQTQNAWSTAFETPLSLSQVYTLAITFITSCPPSNPPIRAQAFPSLRLSAHARPGHTSQLTFTLPDNHKPEDTLYAAVMTGLETMFVKVKISEDGKKEMTFPKNLCGPLFVLITKDGMRTDDENTVAGPAALRFPCDSEGRFLD